MLSITIEPADNGVVKTAFDDSINGAGEEFISRMVYDFEGDETKMSMVKFFEDLSLDLGLETGSELDPNMLVVFNEIGDPSLHDSDFIKERIKVLKQEIKRLESSLK